MRLALIGRRAGDDATHAGGTRSDNAHMRRGDHRIAAAGDVTADAVDRNIFVAELHAGQSFNFDVLDGITLVLREVTDLRLRKLDVGNGLRFDLGHDRIEI